MFEGKHCQTRLYSRQVSITLEVSVGFWLAMAPFSFGGSLRMMPFTPSRASSPSDSSESGSGCAAAASALAFRAAALPGAGSGSGSFRAWAAASGPEPASLCSHDALVELIMPGAWKECRGMHGSTKGMLLRLFKRVAWQTMQPEGSLVAQDAHQTPDYLDLDCSSKLIVLFAASQSTPLPAVPGAASLRCL